MARTIILLLVSLIVIPVLVFRFDRPPEEAQWALLGLLTTVYVILASLCFVVSTITRNYSQVDKLWSIMPIVYAWLVVLNTPPDPRITLMAILVTIWGLRLTYNFSRRGGYSWKFWTGVEDYRWEYLRQNSALRNPVIWTVFNLLFISFYQMGLILLFTLPIVKSVGGPTLHAGDWVLAIALIVMVLIETIADQQQWNFQEAKRQAINDGTVEQSAYAHGFVRSGLWRIVRHPNYAAEQGFWILFYCMSIAATGSWFNWSIAGVLLLLILFKSSADFSEGISAKKYPQYVDYQKSTGRFLPKLW